MRPSTLTLTLKRAPLTRFISPSSRSLLSTLSSRQSHHPRPICAASQANRALRLTSSPRAVTRRCHSTCCGGCGSHKQPDDRKKKAYIALGSNVGDRVAKIEEACREMERRGLRVTRTSSLWETDPMYVLDQDKFINGACEVRTVSTHPTFRVSRVVFSGPNLTNNKRSRRILSLWLCSMNSRP